MNKNQKLWLLLTIPLLPTPCWGQAMMEFGGTQASMVGLGAGLAASLNHGKAVRHSYEAAVKATQAAAAQSQAVEQYMKIGSSLEAKKKWAEAEASFQYVLRVIARRDGPGSVKSVPVLEHLVSVTAAQEKINDAISFQKTVLSFKKASPNENTSAVVNAQNYLSSLFAKKGDYASAEPILRDSVAICRTSPSSLSASQRHNTFVSYAKVLHQLKKDSEAEAIETAEKQELTNEAGKDQDVVKEQITSTSANDQTPLVSDPAKVITTEESTSNTNITAKPDQH